MIYKYYFISKTKKYKIIAKSNNLKELLKTIKLKKNNNDTFILLKLTKNKLSNTSKLNLKTGPLKVDIIYYTKTKRGAYKINDKELRTNFLYYTKEYLEKNGIKEIDLLKIAKASFLNKLNTKLLGNKLIENIKNIKL